MGKKGGSSGPSPQETAQAQAQANKEAVVASSKVNAIDQIAPWGNTTFQRRTGDEPGFEGFGGTPFQQTVNLSPQAQQLFDTQSRIANQVGLATEGVAQSIPNRGFSLSDVPQGIPVAKTLYDRKLSLLRPDLDRLNNENIVNLSDRGIPIGSEVWGEERGRFERGATEALENVARDSILGTAQEEDRQLQRKLTERTQGINELAAALQGSPALPSPSFIQTPAYNVAPPDIQGLQSQQNALNAQSSAQSQAGIGQAIGGLASLAFKSDRNVKRDIGPPERILDRVKKLPVYSWRYMEGEGDSDWHIGPMAQDWKAAFGAGDGRNIAVVDAVGICIQAIKELAAEVDAMKANAQA